MMVFHGLESTLIFWGAIVLIVFAANFFSYRTQASRHRMVETLAEKGQPIPPELLTNTRPYRHSFVSPAQSGIYLMCIGIALAIFFWAMSGGGEMFDNEGHMPHWLPVIGIFPFMLGLARFLAGIFDRPRDK
jgi:hypothetical protein